MKSKNYYHKLINNNKIKGGSDVVLPNGDIDLHLILSSNNSTPKSSMTNNDIAKIVINLITEVREGFNRLDKKIDDVEQNLNTKIDNLDQRLNVIEDRLNRNNII